MFKTAQELYDWGWCRGVEFSQIKDMAIEFDVDGVDKTEYYIYNTQKHDEMEAYFQSLNDNGDDFEGVFE